MSKDNKFKNESQDARRNEQHNASHGQDKMKKHNERSKSEKRR